MPPRLEVEGPQGRSAEVGSGSGYIMEAESRGPGQLRAKQLPGWRELSGRRLVPAVLRENPEVTVQMLRVSGMIGPRHISNSL